MISKLEEQLGTLEVQLTKASRLADFSRKPRECRYWAAKAAELRRQIAAIKAKLS